MRQDPEYGFLAADAPAGENHGVPLRVVRRNGPADRAGLKPGDLLTAIGGQPVHNADQIDRLLHGRPSGDRIDVQFERQGQAQTLALTLGQNSYYVDCDTSLSLRKPELRVKIDREKASDLDIPCRPSPPR